MTRTQALNALERTRNWERRQTAQLRAEILVPYFGGCGCRMHNCRVNFETGHAETGVNGKTHAELAKLARQYDHRQRQIWDASRRLSDAFARYL